MIITAEKIPSYDIAYIRKKGPYGDGNAEVMEELKSWANTNNLLCEDAIILGIAWDDPSTTKPCECRYDSCIVIKKDFITVDSIICRGIIDGGKYAVVKILHTAEDIKKAWEEIFPELLKQDIKLDMTRPVIERYADKMLKNNYCEICVPIK